MGKRYRQNRVIITKTPDGGVDRVYVLDGVYSDEELGQAVRLLVGDEEVDCEHRVVTAEFTTPSEMVSRVAQIRQNDQIEQEMQERCLEDGPCLVDGCPACGGMVQTVMVGSEEWHVS